VRAIEKNEQKPVEKSKKENDLDNKPLKIVQDFLNGFCRYPGEEIQNKSGNKNHKK
jgi:hypothetical protein